VLEDLGGYDPEIFVWANELEFMLRFFDHGYRHLHFPDVAARHMKPPRGSDWLQEDEYRVKAWNCAYIAGKLLSGRYAVGALTAMVAADIRDGLRVKPVAFKAVPDTLRGFAHGVRRRTPVRNPELSRVYRRNIETFASPWWLSRRPAELLRALPRELRRAHRPQHVGRRRQYYEERAHYFPERAATLQF
jgi:hypothetical protein